MFSVELSTAEKSAEVTVPKHIAEALELPAKISLTALPIDINETVEVLGQIVSSQPVSAKSWNSVYHAVGLVLECKKQAHCNLDICLARFNIMREQNKGLPYEIEALTDIDYYTLLLCDPRVPMGGFEMLIRHVPLDAEITAFDYITRALDLPEVRSNGDKYISVLTYIMKFNIFNIGLSSEAIKKLKVQSLQKLRRYKIINPYDKLFENYFVRRFNTDSCFWQALEPSCVHDGERAIIPEDEFWRRYEELSYGIIERLGLRNCYVAGGFVHMCLVGAKNNPGSDVDIFVPFDDNPEQFAEILRKFHDNFKCYYAVCGSVVNIYIEDIKRVFQIISYGNSFDDIYSLIGRFDMSYIQCGVKYDEEGKRSLAITPAAAQTYRDGICRLINPKTMRIQRIFKPLLRGYCLEKSEALIEKYNFDEIYKDQEQIENAINREESYYFASSEHPNRYNLGMITKLTEFNVITEDLTRVLKSIKFGGDFRDGYGVDKLSDITAERIGIIPVIFGTTFLKNGKVPIRFMMGPVSVKNVIKIGENIEIMLDITNDVETYKELKRLDELLKNHFHINPQANKRLYLKVGDNFYINVKVDQVLQDRQMRSKYTLLKTKSGLPLNIEEDLKVGDMLHLIYSIAVNRKINREEDAMFIYPRCLVKINDEKGRVEKIIESIKSHEKKNIEVDFNVEVKFE